MNFFARLESFYLITIENNPTLLLANKAKNIYILTIINNCFATTVADIACHIFRAICQRCIRRRLGQRFKEVRDVQVKDLTFKIFNLLIFHRSNSDLASSKFNSDYTFFYDTLISFKMTQMSYISARIFSFVMTYSTIYLYQKLISIV